MTSRSRLLVLALVGVLLVAAVAAGWLFVYDPYTKKKQLVDAAEAKAQTAEDDADAVVAQTKKLKGYQKQSLPADPQTAKREYQTALKAVLDESGARNATITPPNDTELSRPTGVPFIDQSATRPALDAKPETYLTYIPLTFRVEFSKTDLATVAEVLRRYYALDLLHQITQLSIRRDGTAEVGTDARPQKERADLHVTFTTRALIVSGATARLPVALVSGPHGAVGGGLGLAAQSPPGAEPVLSPKQRAYDLLAAKDPYHGELPAPIPPAGSVSGYVFADDNKNGLFDADEKNAPEDNEKGVGRVGMKLYQIQEGDKPRKFVAQATTNQYGYYKFDGVKPGSGYVIVQEQPTGYESGPATPGTMGGAAGNNEITGVTVLMQKESPENNFAEIPPPPPITAKPDFREFVEYNSWIHTIEGEEHTFTITLKDKINDEDYEVLYVVLGERVKVKATKYYYQRFKTDPADRKKKEYMNEPLLDISKPAAMSNKNVFAVYGVEKDGALLLGERPPAVLPPDPPKGTKPGGKVVLPPPDPKATILGGVAALAPRPEKFYRWESGKTLKQLVELTTPEAEKAIRLSKAWLVEDKKLAVPTTTDTPKPDEKKPEPKK